MSVLGEPINRKPVPDAKSRAETWVAVPGRDDIEQNLETPPKVRTKNYNPAPKVWPPEAFPVRKRTIDDEDVYVGY